MADTFDTYLILNLRRQIMIQFGMRVHDIYGRGTVTEVLDKVQELRVHYVQLAMQKSFSDRK